MTMIDLLQITIGSILLILISGIFDRLRGDKKHFVKRFVEKLIYGLVIGYLSLGFTWYVFAVAVSWILGCSISWSMIGRYMRGDKNQSWDAMEWWQGNPKKFKPWLNALIKIDPQNRYRLFLFSRDNIISLWIRAAIWGLTILPLYFIPDIGITAIWLSITSMISFIASLKLTRDCLSIDERKFLWKLNFGYAKFPDPWAEMETVRGLINGYFAWAIQVIKILAKAFI